ncbi:MAG TPA: lipoate--protein ligase family protein [Candidatus Omnitrophota bacterium]|nr:lipoate--protein ligase family protein [Candidatus Omnitrophota bacterium]
MRHWELISAPGTPGIDNMERDIARFNAFEAGEAAPVLAIYSWRPRCISYGYSMTGADELDLEAARKAGWDTVKRPTGGGIVFHNEAEVSYGLVTAKDDPALPAGLIPSFKKISEAVVRALKKLGVEAEVRNVDRGMRNPKLCFSYPAEYEVVAGGKKIVGSAQKRGKRTLLQQGSIFVRETVPEDYRLLKNNDEAVNAVSLEKLLSRPVGFDEIKDALVEGFVKVLGIEFE